MKQFVNRNLSVLSYAGGVTLWQYCAMDTTRENVLQKDYFKDANDIMGKGDIIMVSCSDGGMVLFVSDSGRNEVRDQARVVVSPMMQSNE